MAGVQQVITAVGEDHGLARALPALTLLEEFRAAVESAHRFQCSSRYKRSRCDGRGGHVERGQHLATNRITGILNGQRSITGDTALRLAHFFGTSAEFRLNHGERVPA